MEELQPTTEIEAEQRFSREIIRPLRSGARIALTTNQEVKRGGLVKAVTNLLQDNDDFYTHAKPDYPRRIRIEDKDGTLLDEYVIEPQERDGQIKDGVPSEQSAQLEPPKERSATIVVFPHQGHAEGEREQKVGTGLDEAEARLRLLKQQLGKDAKFDCLVSMVNAINPIRTPSRTILPDSTAVVIEAYGRTGYGISVSVNQPRAAFEESKKSGYRKTTTSIHSSNRFDPWSVMTGGRLKGRDAISDAVTAAWGDLFGPESEERVPYSRAFISFSNADEIFTRKLSDILTRNDVPFWLAPESLKPGDAFPAEIANAVTDYDKLVVVISKDSLESNWVEREVNLAKKTGKKIVPIMVDNSIKTTENLPPWAKEIKNSLHIEPFPVNEGSPSYHDDFDRAIHRVLKVLKQDEEKQI